MSTVALGGQVPCQGLRSLLWAHQKGKDVCGQMIYGQNSVVNGVVRDEALRLNCSWLPPLFLFCLLQRPSAKEMLNVRTNDRVTVPEQKVLLFIP